MCACTESMVLTLSYSIAIILAFIEASPTSIPLSESYDDLLVAFIAEEPIREAVINEAIKWATKENSKEALKFLKVVREADDVLKKIRHYFDAGKVLFDFNSGKSNLTVQDMLAKTMIMRNETYLNDQLQRLAASSKEMQTEVAKVPTDFYSMLLPVIEAMKKSEQALIPLGNQFKIDMDVTMTKPMSG
ncbi:uncharacterized protein [Bemisia tabaci]|uniref:uncharacterized protein isoform X1 n=1 Tax=Bemisia tabaci TaxID=7038 RepID=UPI003B288CC7